MLQNKRGFTLIELLVVILIIGILAGILISSMVSATNSANDARRKADINQLVKAITIIKTQDGLLPTEANANCKLGSVAGSENCSGIQGKIALQGMTIPTDPNGNYYTYNRVSADDFTLTGILSNAYVYVYDSNVSSYISGLTGSCGSSSGGEFNSAPSINLCSSGSASAVSGDGVPYSWTCTDAGGSANCSATKTGWIDTSLGFYIMKYEAKEGSTACSGAKNGNCPVS